MAPDSGDDRHDPEGETPDADPIADDELIYRRIPMIWHDKGDVSPDAFRARDDDTTGISVGRAKHTTREAFVENDRGRPFNIAVMRAGDLRAAGIEVEPRPEDGDPGHSEIPSQTYANRNDPGAKEERVLIATELIQEVLTPPHDEEDG